MPSRYSQRKGAAAMRPRATVNAATCFSSVCDSLANSTDADSGSHLVVWRHCCRSVAVFAAAAAAAVDDDVAVLSSPLAAATQCSPVKHGPFYIICYDNALCPVASQAGSPQLIASCALWGCGTSVCVCVCWCECSAHVIHWLCFVFSNFVRWV